MHYNQIKEAPAVAKRGRPSVEVKFSSNLAFIIFIVNARQLEKLLNATQLKNNYCCKVYKVYLLNFCLAYDKIYKV